MDHLYTIHDLTRDHVYYSELTNKKTSVFFRVDFIQQCFEMCHTKPAVSYIVIKRLIRESKNDCPL